MMLSQGAPALWGAVSLLCLPSLLNSEYLLRFNLFVPIPGRKKPLGHIPILLSLTQPRSRGCVGALGVGGFVLYLLLQLGEPQETLAFFLCDKNGNKLYFCTLCLCSAVSCLRGREAEWPGCGDIGTETQGMREWDFRVGLWLLVSAQKDEMQPSSAPTPRPEPAEGQDAAWDGRFLPCPAALLGQEPIPRKLQKPPGLAAPT